METEYRVDSRVQIQYKGERGNALVPVWGGGAGTNSWVRTQRGNTRDTSKVVTENNPDRGENDLSFLITIKFFCILHELNRIYFFWILNV
jgi:hypothetical protein